MKFLVLIQIFFLFFVAAHATQIDERKTDIYFGNGVWNTDTAAEEGRIALEILIQSDFPRSHRLGGNAYETKEIMEA